MFFELFKFWKRLQTNFFDKYFSIGRSKWILQEGNRSTGLVKAFQNSNTNKLLFLGRNLVKIICCCLSFTSINFLGKKCWPEIQVCKFVTVVGAIIGRLLKFTHSMYYVYILGQIWDYVQVNWLFKLKLEFWTKS